MDKVKILIVDDHALLRDGISALLGVYDEIEIVGEASEGKEAIEKTRELTPDVILMDLVMPGMDGLEATRRIRKSIPAAKVLVLTQYETKEYMQSAVKAGAVGFLSKKVLGSELLTAILTVNQGDYYFYPSAVAALVDGYRQNAGGAPFDRLTVREREILKLVAEGHTSKKISDMLHISLSTVVTHVGNIMKKLGLHNRSELTKHAIRKELVSTET